MTDTDIGQKPIKKGARGQGSFHITKKVPSKAGGKKKCRITEACDTSASGSK